MENEIKQAVQSQLQRIADENPPGPYFYEAVEWCNQNEPNASGGNRTRIISAYQAGRRDAEQSQSKDTLYTPEQERVAKYIVEATGIGGGEDPIGFLIASHAAMARERKE